VAAIAAAIKPRLNAFMMRLSLCRWVTPGGFRRARQFKLSRSSGDVKRAISAAVTGH